ncbi:efflux RND transporter periplasmic adaptor subunit [Sphingobacterium faecium]|uniref:efflux RND transporter periplasmic adaptor subunit n=1 Tax=Sphingobacterium faecium TaxID=34087 RepID=UPI00097EDF4B|nr:efflux RND transporter periplasmic adaptor subunit [Sphingobacterium faecium]WGQ15651.1 efflux RND transporter periplasmic adaptor subunit [Sphingobacterium faecium]SJN52189.1 Probable Co/Zn/Cd efflux system membrane fusion protein [Sphingobacterium faecium PCAi_F2.5]HCU45185.1 efflux RND transporter periplasmic adaptor subunit [Sphingobacterium sp.]
MKATTTKKYTALAKLLFISFMSLHLLGCHTPVDPEKEASMTLRGDTILVNPEAQVKSYLKTIKVQKELYQLELTTTGTVKAIPNQYAEISAPFSGRVTAVHLKLGMKTKLGTPLFEIASPEFTESQKLFFQAKTAFQNASLILKRQQDLKVNGVGSERDVEEATANYKIAQKEYEHARAALQIFQIDINKLILGQSLLVRSPISGEVITHDIVVGQYIKSDEPSRAKIADLSQVWVVGMVKEQDLNLISKLDVAEISIAAFPDKKIKGTIYHIDEILNEDTRSVQVLVACQNSDKLLKPGLYVSVNFIEKASDVIFIPEKSLLQYNDQSYVLVQIGQDQYLKRSVKTGITDQGKVQVISGLTVGECIISEGAFYLLNAK